MGNQGNQCCCCEHCNDVAPCCVCACRFLCLKIAADPVDEYDDDPECQTCRHAFTDLTWTNASGYVTDKYGVIASWRGTFLCGSLITANPDFPIMAECFLVRQDGRCMMGLIVSGAFGEIFFESDLVQIAETVESCKAMNASFTWDTGYCSLTLTTACSKKRYLDDQFAVEYPPLPAGCPLCNCICDCLCISVMRTDCTVDGAGVISTMAHKVCHSDGGWTTTFTTYDDCPPSDIVPVIEGMPRDFDVSVYIEKDTEPTVIDPLEGEIPNPTYGYCKAYMDCAEAGIEHQQITMGWEIPENCPNGLNGTVYGESYEGVQVVISVACSFCDQPCEPVVVSCCGRAMPKTLHGIITNVTNCECDYWDDRPFVLEWDDALLAWKVVSGLDPPAGPFDCSTCGSDAPQCDMILRCSQSETPQPEDFLLHTAGCFQGWLAGIMTPGTPPGQEASPTNGVNSCSPLYLQFDNIYMQCCGRNAGVNTGLATIIIYE